VITRGLASGKEVGARLPEGLDDLFGDETQKLENEWFELEKMSDDDIRKVRVLESIGNVMIKQRSGSRRMMRHSPLIIRTCLLINQKMGRSEYNEFAKISFLQGQSELNKHRSLGANDPDGLL
jgi:hypothetical protein